MLQGNYNILIVDDSSDDRFILKKILEKKGYFTTESSNWMDALIKIGEGGVDIVILDLKMKEVDGLELLKLIRKDENTSTLPIIVYTSTNIYDAKKCIESGANAFVSKQDSPEVLIKNIQKLLP
ncbi:MAG: response regulator [Pseudomonadota bacterium]